MKKLFTLLLTMLALVQYATAANGLWLEKRDGSKTHYLFEQDVRIAYTRDSVVMITYDATVQYPFNEVKRLYFDESEPDKVEAPMADQHQLIRIVANGVEFKGFAAGTKVVVGDLSGKNIMNRATNENGQLLIKKEHLPQGVTIIKAGKNAIKFNNK